MTVGPGTGPVPAPARAWQPDVGAIDGASTEQKSVSPWDPLATSAGPSTPPLDLAKSSAPAPGRWGAPTWQRHKRLVPWLRFWALAKMASLTYSTWWALSYLHEDLATRICGFGGMCLYAGIRSRWSGRRFRIFGPGMSFEPELYEEIGRWFYWAGVVLVLCGGALILAHGALGTSTPARDHHHHRSAPAAPAAGTNGAPARLGLFIYGYTGRNGLAGAAGGSTGDELVNA